MSKGRIQFRPLQSALARKKFMQRIKFSTHTHQFSLKIEEELSLKRFCLEKNRPRPLPYWQIQNEQNKELLRRFLEFANKKETFTYDY